MSKTKSIPRVTKQAEDFQYLGSWFNTTKKDVEIRLAWGWSAQNNMSSIWKSDLDRPTEISLEQL